MITLKKISKILEEGLNKTLNNPEIQFKIWAEAGHYQKPRREGNNVIEYINGNLRNTASSNDATGLIMGVNQLSLEFLIPVQRPRTNIKQTNEDLDKIKDGQFQFIHDIVEAINNYFDTLRTIAYMEGNDYIRCGVVAGTAVSGIIDMVPNIGNCTSVDVYLELYYSVNGMPSTDVTVYLDGETGFSDEGRPYKALRVGRTALAERSVFADKLTSKNIVTSTALTIDIDLPVYMNKKTVPGALTDMGANFLVTGEPNIARFVRINRLGGNGMGGVYFMTVNSAQMSAENVLFTGYTLSLMEVTDNNFNVPDSYQIAKFIYYTSAYPITFEADKECWIYVDGNVQYVSPRDMVTIAAEAPAFEYNEDTDLFEVCVVSNKAATFTAVNDKPDGRTPIIFKIVKEAKNG